LRQFVFRHYLVVEEAVSKHQILETLTILLAALKAKATEKVKGLEQEPLWTLFGLVLFRALKAIEQKSQKSL
jgi:hypothetical protein